ncbi:MAG: aminopeptidase [Bacteroidales bacterium]|nr:aminopeptidase [Bacteroidales bacterium]
MNLKSVTIAAAVVLPLVASAQAKRITSPDLQMTPVVENPVTSVKNQFRSGTCWCYSGISFLESEAIRLNNIKDTTAYPDFAEMFIVSHSYQERAAKYVRLDGKLNFGPGSEGDDVLDVVRDYGLVPQSAQPIVDYGQGDKILPNHSELDDLAEAYVKVIATKPNKTVSTAWQKGFQGIMDAYLGPCPESFEVDGKTYTPQEYRDSYKINPDDYVVLSSFTHHPFYTKFQIEVSDNWRWNSVYNVPMDEFFEVLYNAVKNGYTAIWGSDVSEAGFTRDGYAFLVDPKAKDKKVAGSDQEHWVGKAKEEAKEEKKNTEAPAEIEPTQELRQKWFDNQETTDDHGMHIFGIAKDQNGKEYFMVKNSWGDTGKFHGIWYASMNFFKGKTMDYIIHKDALPKDLKKKLGIK